MEIPQFIAQNPNWHLDKEYQATKGLIKGALTADIAGLTVDMLHQKLEVFGVDFKEVKKFSLNTC